MNQTEVEQDAIDAVIKLEQSKGWTARDVHKEKSKPYDVESESKRSKEVKCIEVKGNSKDCKIAGILIHGTSKKKLGKLWIYYVTNIGMKDYNKINIYALRPKRTEFKEVKKYSVSTKVLKMAKQIKLGK